ncbi:LytTR family transcriptional regulator DNA-binding domain-containing protein [Sporosarcina trichiuri]|uniref:LytTR family transcriptional regulator DNA-binding domain-containing protein n=1 Tax=Sporosarcina trichiuri TaxID=3056445 RepID=UPI0025B5FEF1|nr:LytTR family transcriptional regulator DNA-binding domain-containing protein [Sporosarcina sp. 0.2-SM1T-5]WJY27322.1 LytTR family transcriptional regulator DNA-binding domain-containing protein [Sporosarcina sp. 0.2-SM1T-5]
MTVEFIQAEKRKHDTVLFPPFDLALTPGEVTAIQSSVNVREELLDLLSGRSSLTHGELKLEVNRPAGFFFLPTGLYERLTVKEMLRFIRQLHGSVQKIPDILRAMQLEDRQNEKISTLSFSEKKRVQLACLLVQDPAVFIFEEPDQNIDLESKRLYHRALQQLRQEEKTVLILTGNLESAVTAADRVYKLDETGLHMIELGTDEAEPEDDLTPSALTVRFEKIPTKVNEKLVLFNPPEIDYIESSDGLTHLHIKGEQFPSTFTLSELEERLLPFGFFRCHRSYLVNLQKVREVITWTRNSYSLILDDPTKTTIPLSKSKMTELKEMLGLK